MISNCYKYFIVLLYLSLTLVKGETIKLEGSIQHQIWAAGALQDSSEKSFQMLVSEDSWWIRTTSMLNGRTTQTSYLAPLQFNLTTFGRQTKGTNQHAGFVNTAWMPDDDGSLINYLWFSYFGHNITTNRTAANGIVACSLRPIWRLDDPDLEQNEFKLSTRLTFLDSGYLKSVEFLNDGFLRYQSGGKSVVDIVPKQFSGFTNASYNVESVRDVQGTLLPETAQFIRYYYSGSGILPRTISRISLIKAEKTADRIGYPSFEGLSFTVDRRFDSKSVPTRYFHTNGQWPSNIEVSNKFRIQQQKIKPSKPYASLRPRAFAAVSMIFISAISIAIYTKTKKAS